MAHVSATKPFLRHLLLWAGALLAVQLTLGAISNGAIAFEQALTWAGLALGFAAYPAGIAAAPATLLTIVRPSPRSVASPR